MFRGTIVALITPFDDLGRIDFEALEKLIHWHLEMGTQGIVLCGSTGEGAALSDEEKCKIFHLGVKISKGRIPIIAGTGGNQTASSKQLTKRAKDLGVDGCLVVVPYYNRPTPEGCFLHFQEIAKADLPIIFYHHPGRTGIKLSAKAIVNICEIPQVVAIKEASGDLNLAFEIMRMTSTPLLSGDDTLSLAHLASGFTGVISIVANVIPNSWCTFVTSVLKEEMVLARKQFFQLYDLCQAMVFETNPQCVKYAVSLLGKCLAHLRLPLIEPREENKKRIAMILEGVCACSSPKK